VVVEAGECGPVSSFEKLACLFVGFLSFQPLRYELRMLPVPKKRLRENSKHYPEKR
jgi:hypothetical protein